MNTNFIRCITKKIRNISLVLVFISLAIPMASASQISLSSNQGNNISITQKTSIKKLFTVISNQTDYHFFYSNKLDELNKRVQINVSNSSVQQVLKIAFKNTTLEYIIKENDILIRQKETIVQKKKPVKVISAIKQTNTVTGVVKDDTNMSLPGVSIIIKGTNTGTTTDFDGNYSIEAKPEDYLVFSYMGFETQTHKVGDNKTIDITMATSANMLDEVIIAGVASGTSKKKMSVSVVKIKADEIGLVPHSSVSSSLSGKVAGVNITSLNGSPGSGSGITIRGATNLSGDSSPMILIDGIIMKGSLADINADDIASMEIVKGAAAAALYGSDAANGVIVITSKRGSELSENQTSVTFRTRVEMQQVAKFLDLADSHPYALAPDWLSVDTYTKYSGVIYPTDYITGSDSGIFGNRNVKADGYMDLPYRVNNNLQESIFTNGLSSTLYLGVGHRNKKTNIFVSLENNKDKGIIIETGGYRRNSFRGNIDHSFNDKLSFSASNNIIKTTNDFMGGGTSAFFEVLMMEPDVDLFKDNADGQKYNYYPNHWNTQFGNPLYDLWRKASNSSKKRYLGSYNLKYNITNWLKFKASYAVETQNYISTSRTPVHTYNSSAKKTLYESDRLNQNMSATLNFSQSWGDLDFKGKLSYILEDDKFESTSTTSDDYRTDIVAEDYFAIASFVYKDRYIFDALFRNDGSSLFGENERRHNYYRLSGAYRLTQDIEIPNVEELKLRVAYGTAGLRPGFSYQYETYTDNNNVLFAGNLGNVDLKPARNTELEFGLDVSFLDRFYVEANYARTKTEDSFVNVPLLAPVGGFRYQWQNVGTLESNTFEALVKAKLIKKDKFKWDLGVTFDRSRSKILEFNVPPFTTGPRGAFKMEDDGQYGLMYGIDFVRSLDQMEAQLPTGTDISEYSVNRDGVVVKTVDIGTVNERAFRLLDENGIVKEVVIGDINPDFRMGINTTLTYKNFSLYTLWKLKSGGDLYNGTAQYLVRDLRHPMMDQMHTKPENKKTVNYYQSLYDAQSLNSYWVEDASYIRLNEVSIYYDLNKKSKLLSDSFMKSFKIGLIGKNLVTFTNYSGYDPEAGYSGFLFDNYGYPNFRTYAVSLDFKF